MNILLDMDGVIVEWNKPAMAMANITEYPCPGTWNWTKHLGLGKSFWDKLDEEWYANLEWSEDGKEIYQICQEFGDVYILTSCTLVPGCLAGKMRWIQREAPELQRKALIGAPKILCDTGENILVDDGEHNFKEWTGPGILIPRIWNKYKDINISVPEFLRRNLEILSVQECLKG